MADQTSDANLYLKAVALSLVRAGKFDAGIEVYNRYLASAPEDDEAWAGLGGAYRRKGDLDSAIASYEKAHQLNPRSTYALVNVVSLRACRNSPEDMERNRGYVLEALRAIREIISKGQDDYWTWYDLATLQLIEGKTSEAIRSLNYAAERTPETAKENFRSVLSNLNFIKEHNSSIGGLDEAIEIINRHLT
ncbi:MAG TPA: tetratricopeptide repeat protein [Blastocatellia bacterium]|jgi:tetratricopeptide (TPR) repeat protein|nr:tetratricopeptide repeat protein [Blastocatellia bacterium]